MNISALSEIAHKLVSDGKGILAADESDSTITKRFDAIQIASTPETHAAYRELLFTTSEIEKYISGVILYEETLKQKASDGRPFPTLLSSRGIVPGIKVDLGTTDLPETRGEKITLGLDNLQSRLWEYKKYGVQFAKWRAVFRISADTPTDFAIEENARALAEYALVCQHAEIVPIVEPEVLMEGDHTIERCREVTTKIHRAVFLALSKHEVALGGILLKPNMIVPGSDATEEIEAERVARETVEMLKETTVAEVPGIVFLSGGEEPEQALDYLSRMNKLGALPWKLSFSFGRALQDEALHLWAGDNAHKDIAQAAFRRRVQLTSLAATGKYELSQETV